MSCIKLNLGGLILIWHKRTEELHFKRDSSEGHDLTGMYSKQRTLEKYYKCSDLQIEIESNRTHETRTVANCKLQIAIN